jgi:hypothetical protein
MATNDESPNYEELFERFRQKMAMIPRECWPAMGWLYAHRHLQEQRLRLENRARQLMASDKQVFWARVLPAEVADPIGVVVAGAISSIEKYEEKVKEGLTNAMRNTSWFLTVAVPAAQNSGITRSTGELSAAKILWAIGSARRFATFGKIVKYCGLAPEDGHCAKRRRGHKCGYNPQAFQSLFDLSECWLRNVNSPWRIMWDGYKAACQQKHPDWPKLKVHRWGQRKTMREFLRRLYELWTQWEEDNGDGQTLG